MAGLFTPNGQKTKGEKQFKEQAASIELWLKYFACMPPNERASVFDEAGYQLSLYNLLIEQAADTLSESEIKTMKENLLQFAAKLG